jgi:hypothetical protein
MGHPARRMGHPRLVVVSACSRFLDSARSSALRMIFLRSE